MPVPSAQTAEMRDSHAAGQASRAIGLSAVPTFQPGTVLPGPDATGR
jgi:hypothetical protein